MLASLETAPLADPRFAYEPKYDGVRALVGIEPGTAPGGVRIRSRLGADKTAQFPEIVRALDAFRRTLRAPLVVDGEIVATDAAGEPAGFQRLQGRIHLTDHEAIAGRARAEPVVLIVFDVLRDGAEDLRPLPLAARRARLERILSNVGSPAVRLSQFAAGDGTGLCRDVMARGGEGLVAKRLDAPYRSGRRTPEWRKVKLARRQECVIGGWTEPRRSRAHLGALLLGLIANGELRYVGHTGTGFTGSELERLAARLRPLERATSPFSVRPETNERPHWVEPRLVAEVKFSDWTRDGRMRHPVYLGLRGDVEARTVSREPAPWPAGAPGEAPALATGLARVLAQLERIEGEGGAGTVVLPGGGRLPVSHLAKALWPSGITKGELMRYYVRVAPFLLPAVRDRPLVMRRFPAGIGGKAFYQQRAPAAVPDGVRVAVLPSDTVVPSRLVGGSLLTLLYMVQIGAISQDPWFSRVQSPDFADHAAFDLDPMPGVPFSRVLDVARWIHDELVRLGTPGVPKTSGASGLHIYVPLPRRTAYEAGRLFCQIIATMVAGAHPRVATVERAVHARGSRVYVDYLQNARGKTLATAYSARATAAASVSAPLTWDEVEGGVDPRDFTLRTMPSRLDAVGDCWAVLRQSRGADLSALLRDPR